MADQRVRIHFMSGQKIDVPGTVPEVQARLLAGGGGLVAMKDHRSDDIAVNLALVESLEKAPGRGVASF